MGCHGMGWRIDIPSSKLLHINLTGHKFQVIFFFLRLERRTGISSRHHHHRLPIYYAYTYGTIKSRSCSSNYHLNMVLAAINCQRASDRRLNLRSRRRFPISFEFALVFHDHPSIHPDPIAFRMPICAIPGKFIHTFLFLSKTIRFAFSK